MCINIKFIPNRSKVISPFHRERLLVPVKCGYCFECQRERHNEWYYRIYHEWLDTFRKGGYVFFDTLTYANDYLPHINDFIPLANDALPNWSCFSRPDLRSFLTTLHSSITRKFSPRAAAGVRHFIAAEYGTDDRFTHRPHYHCLFFVTSDIKVDALKAEITNCWYRGRTDSVRKFGDKSNYFTSKSSSEINRRNVSHYVAKYVQKSSLFQSRINERIAVALDVYVGRYSTVPIVKTKYNIDTTNDYFPSLTAVEFDCYVDTDIVSSIVKSEHFKDYRRKLKRTVDQFHIQSKGFGLSALDTVNVDDLIEKGYLTMPDTLQVNRKIALPKYYERKLFEETIVFHGRKLWQPTKKGLIFRQKKELRCKEYLSDRYRLLVKQYNLRLRHTPEDISRYVVFRKGRYDGELANFPTLGDKLRLPNKIYQYVTPSDKLHLHGAFVTRQFQGFSTKDEPRPPLVAAIPYRVFLRRHCHSEPDFEDDLAKLEEVMHTLAEAKQRANDVVEYQRELFVLA